MYDLIGDILIVKKIKNIKQKYRLLLLKTEYKGIYRIPEFRIITINNAYNLLNSEIDTLVKKYKLEKTIYTTIYKENKCRFLLDVTQTYISNRYANERIDILKYFTKDDIVLVLFDGIGIFSIFICKIVKYVYGLDLNTYCKNISLVNCSINKIKNYNKFNIDINCFNFDIFYTKVVTINPYLFFNNFLYICKHIKCKLIIDYILIYNSSKTMVKSILEIFYKGKIEEIKIVRNYSKDSSIFRFITLNPGGLLPVLYNQ